MYVVGVGLVKVYKALIRLVRGGSLCPPSDVYVRSFLCPFLYFFFCLSIIFYSLLKKILIGG